LASPGLEGLAISERWLVGRLRFRGLDDLNAELAEELPQFDE
jgi:hypothetical protein